MAKSIASACAYSDSVIDREDDEDHSGIEDSDPPDYDQWESRRRRRA